MVRKYNIKNNEICRNCNGEGIVRDERGEPGNQEETICPVCKGYGIVNVERKIDITVTPKFDKPHGTIS